MRVPRQSLRTQLVLWNALALVFLLGILGLALRYTVAAGMLASVDHELDARSQPLLHHMPPKFDPNHRWRGFEMRPPPPGEMPPPRDGHRHGGPPDDPYSPRLFDLTGRRVGPPGGAGVWDHPLFAASRRGHTLYETLIEDNVPMRVLSRPVPATGPVQGIVQVAVPLTDVNKAIQGVNHALLLLIPVGLLCAGAAGAYLTNRVLRRVRLLTQAAGRISAHDPSERLYVAGNDEFSELAQTFNALLGRLESAFRHQQELVAQQRHFTADASHELKTPLTVIQGNASLALSDPAIHGEAAESLREIHQAAGTMSRLVQDLLLLARSDDGQLGRDQIAVPVQELLTRATKTVSSGAPIAISVPDPALCVLGNPDELQRLFRNLLENARHYTPTDGQITVSAVAEGRQVIVTIADTGSGIALEHLPHLGERFYRVDQSRARQDGGTGLGLSICQSITKAHGGTMAITSVLGQGTTVTLTLPAG
jgi:two-component system OmpR family sensor kinase